MSEYELGRRGCVFTVPHRYVMAVLLMGVFLVAMGGGRSSFALVMAHVTSGQEAKAENALFPQCTTLNTTQDLHVVMSGDKVFLLHAVFYSGFTLTRLPGALLSTWLSPTRVLGTCVLLISASVLSLPLVLPLNNTPLLFALRFFQGGLEGVYQPVVDGLVAAWSTPEEQSRLVTIVYTGLFLAPALALVVAGTTLCYVSWDTPFYTYGLAGIVLSAVWFKYAYDTPDQHPGLSHAERVHHKNHGMAVRQSSKKVSIPWRCIMTSFPVWAFVIASFCKTAVLTTLIMAEPQYFLDAYHMNSADIGLMAAVPHVLLGVTCSAGGVLSDWLLRHGFTVTVTRKFIYTFGFGLEGLSLLSLFWVREWRLAITVISVGTALGGLGVTGFLPLPMDMAPQYASVISGLTVIGTVGGVVSTLCASVIAGRTRTLGDWQLLYLVMGVIHLAGVLAFDLGVSAERQPWAHSPDNRVTLHPPQSDGVRKRVVREGGEGGSEKEAETVLDDHVERETMPLLK